MSMLGIPRLSRPKMASDVPFTRYDNTASSPWREGCHPDMGPKVLVLHDSDYIFSRQVPPGFRHGDIPSLRAQLRFYFGERWFSRPCRRACLLYVYEGGILIAKTPFVLNRHYTSRAIRNDFVFSLSEREWRDVYITHEPAASSLFAQLFSRTARSQASQPNL